jgi:Ribonuclease G/E
MTKGENSEIAELRRQLADAITMVETLRQQYGASTERADTLNQFIMRVAGASSVEEVLKRGFDTLSAQLEPLRDLTPKRTLLSEAALNQLGDLRKSLKRPDWSNGRAFTDYDLNKLSPDDRIELRGEAL